MSRTGHQALFVSEPDESAIEPPRYHADWLSGGRLHLSDGPIDLVIGLDGPRENVEHAFKSALKRFASILDELVSELPTLRRPLGARETRVRGSVARRMLAAATLHRSRTVTPMIAVAGAVADEVLDTMAADDRLRRAYVNNGGDIALSLAGDARFRVGTAARPTIRDVIEGARIDLGARDGVRGIATSGLGGRSMTLGIADAVTTLAPCGAEADVAATLIANAVDVDDDRIQRVAASELDPDSDLGERLVTVSRGDLPLRLVHEALERGCEMAQVMISEGRIRSALLQCDGQVRVVGGGSLIAA